MNNQNGPQRIVCLTAETAETLYLLGKDERIVGISGFTTRPKQARQKPKIATFTSATIEQILELRPDLAIRFSKLQAQMAHDLIKAGVSVLIFNQQSVEEVLESILAVARLLLRSPGGLPWWGDFRTNWRESRNPRGNFRAARGYSLKNGWTRSSAAFAGWKS